MPSIIPGFEYDVFISYRHNDNRPSSDFGSHSRGGWVTEFVKNLNEELAATIKDPVSVYFDENPHDGLLETHDVDESLKEKLKCLIFIPIISQTYCDPKSFAWKNEFLAFKKLASEDQFGLKVKLQNGNVANRILTVRIHELDEADKIILENEIGQLRAIDFIFKSSGVNRPLRMKDDDIKEVVHLTFYRDQINKVANAVKDIVQGASGRPIDLAKKNNPLKEQSRERKKSLAIVSLLLLLTIVAGYFLYSQFQTSETIDKSIAVLPFVDMTPKKELEYYGDGVADEIITVLGKIRELKVIARTSSFQFKGKNEDMRKIGDALGVATVLEGSVRESESDLHITAQLIRSSNGVQLWSKTFNCAKQDMFSVQNEIAAAVAEELKTSFNPVTSKSSSKRNEAAYKLYQQGRFFYDRGADGDMMLAKDYFRKSVAIDSSQAIVWHYLSESEHSLSDDNRDLVVHLTEKALSLDPNLADAIVLRAQQLICYDKKFKEAERELQRALRVGTPSSYMYRNIGYAYLFLGDATKGIAYGKKAVELDPLQPHAHNELGNAYFSKKQFDSSANAFKKITPISHGYSGFRLNLFFSLLGLGKIKEAQGEMLAEPDEFVRNATRCYVEFALGHKKQSDSLLNVVRRTYEQNGLWYRFAVLRSYRKEKDEAIKCLYRSYEANEINLIQWIKTEPFLDPLRNDQRFVALLKKIGFDN